MTKSEMIDKLIEMGHKEWKLKKMNMEELAELLEAEPEAPTEAVEEAVEEVVNEAVIEPENEATELDVLMEKEVHMFVSEPETILPNIGSHVEIENLGGGDVMLYNAETGETSLVQPEQTLRVENGKLYLLSGSRPMLKVRYLR